MALTRRELLKAAIPAVGVLTAGGSAISVVKKSLVDGAGSGEVLCVRQARSRRVTRIILGNVEVGCDCSTAADTLADISSPTYRPLRLLSMG